MTTLTTLKPLLDRLFASAKGADAPLRHRLQTLPKEERDALFERAKTDYLGFYGSVKDAYLPISEETGALLYLLARTSKAKSIVEYGTSFGISTIHLAAALKDNGGGTLIGSEFLKSKVDAARASLKEAGLDSFVDVREGDALETLARDLPASIDLVLLDGAKVLYGKILQILEPRLRDGAIIVADNADDAPDFIAHVRKENSGYLAVPFRDDVEILMRAR